jgi:hypothetical protein
MAALIVSINLAPVLALNATRIKVVKYQPAS